MLNVGSFLYYGEAATFFISFISYLALPTARTTSISPVIHCNSQSSTMYASLHLTCIISFLTEFFGCFGMEFLECWIRFLNLGAYSQVIEKTESKKLFFTLSNPFLLNLDNYSQFCSIHTPFQLKTEKCLKAELIEYFS